MSIVKTCSKCQEAKDESEFYPRKTAKDGLVSHCKDCKKLYADRTKKQKQAFDKTYYLKNKERIDSQAIAYYWNNKQERQEYQRKILPRILKKRRLKYRDDLNYKLTC